MKKKLVFIGIGLLVAAVVLFVLSGYLLTKGVTGNINFTNITVGAQNFSYLPITYNGNNTAVAIYAFFSSPANLYVFNNTAFTRWYGYMSVNKTTISGYQYAQTLGANSSYLFKNSSIQVIPLNFKTSALARNVSGRLYVVIDNTRGSKSSSTQLNASISYIPLNTSTVILSAALGYGVLIAGLAGIILIIWGLLKKDEREDKGKVADKNGVTADQKKYLDRLYKGVKKNKDKEE